MKLKDACIQRDGKEEGLETYRTIMQECREAVDDGDFDAIEEILYDNGFEPDYIMDVLHKVGNFASW